jgi:hypothetical protein
MNGAFQSGKGEGQPIPGHISPLPRKLTGNVGDIEAKNPQLFGK